MVELYEKEYYYSLYPEYKKILPHIKKFGQDGALFFSKLVTEQNKTIKFVSNELDHPLYLRNNTSDIPTFFQIFYELDYDIQIKNPKIIVDCGANIGLSSVFFKKKFPNSKIIAIEPEESNYELLLKNIEGYDNICPLKRAVWNKNGYLTINNIGLGNWGFIVKEENLENNNTIKAVSIKGLMNIFDIDYIDILKLDIEGSEKEVFEINFQEWMPFVKCIIVELHDRFKKGCTESFNNAIGNYKYDILQRGENIVLFKK